MQKVSRSHQTLTVLNKLLYIALENISQREILEQFIDKITSLSWLALKSKGAIFLVGEDPQVLEMKAHRALNASLLSKCARVPFGRCLCGKAALTGELQFADCIDERHEKFRQRYLQRYAGKARARAQVEKRLRVLY